jgi:hypothetical protein
MQSLEREAGESCLSLADGYLGQCPIVREHNQDIGANPEDVIKIPQKLRGEFTKLSTNLYKLGRAFELGLID